MATKNVVSLSDLADMNDGELDLEFGKCWRDALQSCANQPEVDGARKVTLVVSLVPRLSRGRLDDIVVTHKLRVTGVPRATNGTVLGVETSKDGIKRVYCAEFSRRDPDQLDLPISTSEAQRKEVER